MRKNPTYMALLGPTRLLISEKFATYTIIWQVRVLTTNLASEHYRLTEAYQI